jgi:hypothetical protein
MDNPLPPPPPQPPPDKQHVVVGVPIYYPLRFVLIDTESVDGEDILSEVIFLTCLTLMIHT